MAVLKLGREQEDSFRQQAEADFNRRVLLHVRRDLKEPAAGLTDEDILGRVRECGPRAEQYGFVTERQLMYFVDTSILLGANFEQNSENAWARKLLASDQLGAADKANLLLATACSIYKDKKDGSCSKK